MADLAELKKEIARLESELQAKKAQLHALNVAALPWKVGDVVRMTATSYALEGSEHKIVGVYSAELGWPRVISRKKDGSFGTRERTLYRDFEVIERA